MDLVITTKQAEGARAVVTVSGDVDVFSAPAVRAWFAELVDGGHHHLAVQLDEVEFLDSTGIGAFVAVRRRVRLHGGSLRLVCTNERVARLFRMTVPGQLPTYRSLAEAYADEVVEAPATVGGPT